MQDNEIRQHILNELNEYAQLIEIRESKPDKTYHESIFTMYARANAIQRFAEKLGFNAGLAYFIEEKQCKVWCNPRKE